MKKDDEIFDPNPKPNWNWIVGTVTAATHQNQTFEEIAKKNNRLIKARQYMPIKLKDK